MGELEAVRGVRISHSEELQDSVEAFTCGERFQGGLISKNLLFICLGMSRKNREMTLKILLCLVDKWLTPSSLPPLCCCIAPWLVAALEVPKGERRGDQALLLENK